jgi:hypothetical protein
MIEAAEQGMPTARGRKSVPWRRDPGILARLREVERRHLAGMTNVAVAEALDVDETTIRRDLERLRELWLEQTKESQADLRAQMLAKLEDVRVRALQAAEFDERCERAVLFGDEQIYRDDKGSASFRGNKAGSLAQARQATMDQAKLLGLVIEKQEHAGELLVRQYVGVPVDAV